MLKSELEAQLEIAHQSINDNISNAQKERRRAEEYKTSLETTRHVSEDHSQKLDRIMFAIVAVVAMKYTTAELNSNFYPNNEKEAEIYQAILEAQPEELCLLRHLYSLAQ